MLVIETQSGEGQSQSGHGDQRYRFTGNDTDTTGTVSPVLVPVLYRFLLTVCNPTDTVLFLSHRYPSLDMVEVDLYYCRTHNVCVCLYIAYKACGSASLYIKTLYFSFRTSALAAAATVPNKKISYAAKTPKFAIFGTRVICVFYSILILCCCYCCLSGFWWIAGPGWTRWPS